MNILIWKHYTIHSFNTSQWNFRTVKTMTRSTAQPEKTKYLKESYVNRILLEMREIRRAFGYQAGTAGQIRNQRKPSHKASYPHRTLLSFEARQETQTAVSERWSVIYALVQCWENCIKNPSTGRRSTRKIWLVCSQDIWI